jgi:hypothetical protein
MSRSLLTSLFAAFLMNAVTLAQAPSESVVDATDFSALPPVTVTFNAGGGPQGDGLLAGWGCNVWKAGERAEVGITAQPVATARAMYLVNQSDVPAVQVFKDYKLLPSKNYVASLIYMTEEGAAGGFEVRGEGMETAKDTLGAIGVWKERVIPFTAPADGVAKVHVNNGSVGRRLYVRSVAVKRGPDKWFPDAADLPAPGATIDESAIARTIHVNATAPAASDDGDGADSARPLKTFSAALRLAAASLRDGAATKIELAAGTYRDGGLVLDGEKIGGQAVDTPLVIEGAEPGTVSMTGADAADWEPTTWKLVDAAKRIYSHAWPHNWGPSDAGYYKQDEAIGQRREILVVNGRRFKQKLVENLVYNKGGWAPRVNDEGMRAEGNWRYEGYVGPQVLEPGEFGVAEMGPGETIAGNGYDGHSDPNTIFLRLPDDVPTLDDATIEVGVRPQWLRVFNKNNLVLRNLVVENHAANWGGAAFEVEWFQSRRDNRNWLIDRCAVRGNGGEGARIHWVRGITVRGSTFADNGDNGMALILRDALMEDCTLTGNGWRGGAKGMKSGGHGMWFAARNLTARRVTATGNNGFGIRNDHSGEHLTFEQCRFSENLDEGGAYFEIAWGPVTLRDTQIANNAGCGLRVLSTSGLTLERCRVIDNEVAQLYLEADKRNVHLMFDAFGVDYPIPYPYVRRTAVRDSVLATRRGRDSAIYSKIHWGGDPAAYVAWFGNEFTGSGNRYWNPDNDRPFNVASAWERKDWTWVDLTGWREATRSDADSTWATPE